MDQYVLFHFAVQKNDRVFQVIVQPGTPWDDLQEVLEEFKQQFINLQEAAKKKEQEETSIKAELTD